MTRSLAPRSPSSDDAVAMPPEATRAPSPRLRRSAGAGLLTLLLLGCAADDPAGVADLQERVEVLEVERAERDAAAEAELAALQADIGELRAALETATGGLEAATTDLADVTADVALLLDALTVLEEEVAIVEEELRAAVVGLEQEQRDTAAELRSGLTALDGRVDRVAGQVEELRTLVVTVRDRLDRCQADGSC